MTLTVEIEYPAFVEGLTILTDLGEITAALRNPATVMTRETPPEFVAGTVLAIDGAAHVALRRAESRIFTAESLDAYERNYLFPTIDQMIKELVARDEHVSVDLVKLGSAALARVGCSIAGVTVRNDNDVRDLLDLLDSVSAAARVEFLKVDATQHQRIVERGLSALEDLRVRYFNPATERRRTLIDECRRGNRDPADLPADILTILLAGEAGDFDDEDLPLREVIVYLLASIGTSVRALCNCVHELFHWFENHPEDMSKSSDEGFLRGAIHETLRLHPVLPLILRTASKPITLPSGRVLSEGERFAIVFSEANRDPDLYGDDAAVFDPYRLERLASKHGYGLAFGSGPHMCIGRRVAAGGATLESAESQTRGSLLTILVNLFAAGMGPHPNEEPRRKPATFYEEFVSFPVLLSKSSTTASQQLDFI